MSEIEKVKRVLKSSRVIALVGASLKPERASYRVMAFLLNQGYQVIPVNPVKAGQQLHGQTILASLQDISETVDLVDVFRNSEAAASVVDDAISIGAKAVWMQLGVINQPAADRAEAAGLDVIMDRCPAIDIPSFGISKVS
ncbi:CoA-binding protein [Neptunomonas japonica]|uniref:CoA-binding protein n=1 Tax=Neptunomonas japonica TaxID=417574 RepID=UPI0004104D7F|nr:CoA-binding protein [Neptunomonas japonica]